MSVSIQVPVRAARVAVAAVSVLAAVLLVGLWGERAHADHDPDASLHVCVRSNGNLRLGTDCRRGEARHVLATDGSVQAAHARVEELEARVAELEAAGPDDQDASRERAGASTEPTTEVPCDEGGPCNPSTMEQRVAALEDTVAAHGTDIANLQTSVAGLLNRFVGVTRTTVNGNTTLRFSGMNVQVVNNTGSTNGTPNGVGNLIVGYDSNRPSGSDKSGSHYLIVGNQHNYTRFGGIVSGFHNTASGDYASVSGGRSNTASGDYASVSGGRFNTASGDWSSVSGGYDNTASEWYASVSGGHGNTADGDRSSILGGNNRTVISLYGCHPSCVLLDGVTRTTVNGQPTLRFSGMNVQVVNGTGSTDGTSNGVGNLIVGYDSNRPSGSDKSGSHYLIVGDWHNYTRYGGIVSGFENTASGACSSVFGGFGNTASGACSSVSGGWRNTASGAYSSVLGGDTKTVSNDRACHPSCG